MTVGAAAVLRHGLTVSLLALCASIAGAQANGSIHGRVTDQNRQPVAGALIDARPTLRRVTSDEEGRFVLNDLAPGSYSLHVRRIGFEPVVVRVDVGTTVTTTTVTLTAIPFLLDSVRIRERASGLRYSAIVVDEAGVPVPEASVVAEGINNKIQTDSAGHFLLSDAKRGTLVIRVRKIGYLPFFGSFRLIGEREDTLRMSRLAQTLAGVEVLERSGFGRDTFVYRDLDARMRWKSNFAGVISREELDQVGKLNLCDALFLTPTGTKLGIHPPCPSFPVCVILDGERAVWRPLSGFFADRVETVEVFPPNTDISGTLAARGCAAKRQRALERTTSSSLQPVNPLFGPFVIWMRKDVPGSSPAQRP